MNLGRIILPYGMKKNYNGEWVVFNKHENPLGCLSNHALDSYKLPVRLNINGLGEMKLRKLAFNTESIIRDTKGNICRVYFYQKDSDRLTPEYFKKLEILETLQINQIK